MEFDDLMKGLGEKLGVELAVDESGACVLGVDALQVTIQYLDELSSVAVWSMIGEPPPQGLEDLLSAMLNANHLFRGTGGATLSRDTESGNFFLCRCDPIVVLDVETFAQRLEKFVNTVEVWQKLLVDYRPETTVGNAERPADDRSFGAGSFISV